MIFPNAMVCAAVGATFLTLVPISSPAADPSKAPAAIDAPAIYLRHCAACHGERGDGNSRAQAALAKKPRDFTAEESRQRLTREYMIAIVRDGRPHTPMMPRSTRLSQDEIEAVVDYIRSSFMTAGRQAPPAKAN